MASSTCFSTLVKNVVYFFAGTYFFPSSGPLCTSLEARLTSVAVFLLPSSVRRIDSAHRNLGRRVFLLLFRRINMNIVAGGARRAAEARSAVAATAAKKAREPCRK
jgi:hypothetical protein